MAEKDEVISVSLFEEREKNENCNNLEMIHYRISRELIIQNAYAHRNSSACPGENNLWAQREAYRHTPQGSDYYSYLVLVVEQECMSHSILL